MHSLIHIIGGLVLGLFILALWLSIHTYYVDDFVVSKKDVIGGLATHGHTIESVHMYKRMQSFGIRPDEITFLCMLTACAHGGLVKEAWYFFHSLHEYGMTPKCEHYDCMVDVLAQAGQLTEAYKFVDNIPIKPTPSMLGALLNGCLNHRDLNLAEVVGKKLIALQPDHDGRYVGLSNVYASGKRWYEARTMSEVLQQDSCKMDSSYVSPYLGYPSKIKWLCFSITCSH